MVNFPSTVDTFKIDIGKINFVIIFSSKIPQIATSGAVYKLQSGLCNESYYGKYFRHLAVRSGEHIAILLLPNKSVQPRKDSAAYHHLLNYNYSPTFEDFIVLCHENKKYLLEIKKSVLIMRDRPSMNQTVGSSPLYLFK